MDEANGVIGHGRDAERTERWTLAVAAGRTSSTTATPWQRALRDRAGAGNTGAARRAFSIFYTGTIGAGALSPVLYGAVSDIASVPAMMTAVAAVVLLTLPLAWTLRPTLGHRAAEA